MRLYISSKLKYASKWRSVAQHLDVISTWIENPEIPATEEEQTTLCRKIIAEASMASHLLVYRANADEQLKGGFIEVGAALANGAKVLAVGFDDHTFTNHPNVVRFSSLDDALIELEAAQANEEYEKQIKIDPEPMSFDDELRVLINRHCKENGSNTPDFILAKHIDSYMQTLEPFMRERDEWYGLNKTSPINISKNLEEPNDGLIYFRNAIAAGDIRYYQKHGKVKARLALPGERVFTVINGEAETNNTAKDGDYLVEGVNGEHYLLSAKEFNERYVWVSNHVNDWAIYDAIGRTYAVCYNGEPITFKAPWGETTFCDAGDFLCSTSLDEIAVYRVERNTFFQTYSPLPKGVQ